MDDKKTGSNDGKWCVYGSSLPILGFCPWGVGRIVKETQNSYEILYSEGQMYPSQTWDKRYVMRFSKLEEAVDFYVGRTDANKSKFHEKIREDFPKQRLTAILN